MLIKENKRELGSVRLVLIEKQFSSGFFFIFHFILTLSRFYFVSRLWKKNYLF